MRCLIKKYCIVRGATDNYSPVWSNFPCLRAPKKEKEKKEEPVEVINLQTDVDAVDYDGMGNQGRFPRKVNFK